MVVAFLPRLFVHTVIFLLFAVTGLGAENPRADRVALIIGNSEYDHVSRLANPANDAEDISVALERIGFTVIRHLNLDYRAMRLALRDFAEQAANAEMALVYFAGHGIELDNTNYLIPTNAALRSDRDIEFEAIRLNTVINSVATTDGLKLILIDACRNNPFLSNMERTSATRSIGRGLGRIDPGGVLVGYAARGGTLALDGHGRNSPYAQAILQHIEEPGLELGKMFRKVRDTVFELTDGFQEPFTYGSLPGNDIFLLPQAETAVTAEEISATAALSVVRQMLEDFATADENNSIEEWAGFLNRYSAHPNKRLLKIAAERHATLQKPHLQDRKETPSNADRLAPVEQKLPIAASTAAEALEAEEAALGLGRADYRNVQLALQDQGFSPGPADGVFGKRSRAALGRFEVANGNTKTRYLNKSTHSKLLNLVPKRKTDVGISSASSSNEATTPFDGDYEIVVRRRWDDEYAKYHHDPYYKPGQQEVLAVFGFRREGKDELTLTSQRDFTGTMQNGFPKIKAFLDNNGTLEFRVTMSSHFGTRTLRQVNFTRKLASFSAGQSARFETGRFDQQFIKNIELKRLR